MLSGRPTLRGLDTERELSPGDFVACPTGRDGAHRLDNRQSDAVRVLIVSTMLYPEINEYPDSGKVMVRKLPPWRRAASRIARDDPAHRRSGGGLPRGRDRVGSRRLISLLGPTCDTGAAVRPPSL